MAKIHMIIFIISCLGSARREKRACFSRPLIATFTACRCRFFP